MRLNRILLFSLLICFVFPIVSYADQLEDAKGAIKNEEFEKAYELLLPLAEENNAEAQTILGSTDLIDPFNKLSFSWYPLFLSLYFYNINKTFITNIGREFHEKIY